MADDLQKLKVLDIELQKRLDHMTATLAEINRILAKIETHGQAQVQPVQSRVTDEQMTTLLSKMSDDQITNLMFALAQRRPLKP